MHKQETIEGRPNLTRIFARIIGRPEKLAGGKNCPLSPPFKPILRPQLETDNIDLHIKLGAICRKNRILYFLRRKV